MDREPLDWPSGRINDDALARLRAECDRLSNLLRAVRSACAGERDPDRLAARVRDLVIDFDAPG